MPSSFTTDLDECPRCGAPLTGSEGPPSIKVDGHETSIGGDDGDFYRTYLLDPAGNGCLILDNPKPMVRCLACDADLAARVDTHEEI